MAATAKSNFFYFIFVCLLGLDRYCSTSPGTKRGINVHPQGPHKRSIHQKVLPDEAAVWIFQAFSQTGPKKLAKKWKTYQSHTQSPQNAKTSKTQAP